ncbi:MAG: M48 family metalloprotease [Candidatus Sericytochromatia bacterium]|nr:M48 family metalloprotease [Candidatus Sericytochromatia bacterium]
MKTFFSQLVTVTFDQSSPSRLRRAGHGLMVAALLTGMTGCVQNPVTGSREFSLLSPEQELALGTQGDAEVTAQIGLYNDPAVAEYVNRLGQALAAKSDQPSLKWHFKVLNSPEINAFAMPGGFIYINRGLLPYLQNEAQLAVILGHEIAHVTARHSAKAYTASQLTDLGLGIGSLVFSEIRPFLGAIQTGLKLLSLKYSRDDETSADDLGVKYATRSGYQAGEAAGFFASLNRIQNQQQGGSLPTWASDHPDPADRQLKIQARTTFYQQQYPSSTYTGTDSATFLPRLDRLVFGKDTRQGLVKNGFFYQPERRFQLPIPSGWQIGYFPDQVQMAPAGNSPSAALTLVIRPAASPATAADDFVAANKAQPLEGGAVMVNGFAGYRLKSQVTVDNGQGGSSALTVLSYFISKGDRLYTFNGFAPPASFASHAATFEGVFTGFAELTDPTILGTQPGRLTVFTAPSAGTFQSLVNPNAAYGIDVGGLAILNMRQLTDAVAGGTYLKDVR